MGLFSMALAEKKKKGGGEGEVFRPQKAGWPESSCRNKIKKREEE